MLKKSQTLLIIAIIFVLTIPSSSYSKTTQKPVRMAVEFVSHAACAHIAQAKGWYEEEGLNVTSYENYITGMALAAALSKGDINAAYICLIPAIVAYANGGVKIKVVCGTHKYGYGLVVNPKKVKVIQDLMKDNVRVACAREGSPVDAVMHKMIERYHLDAKKLTRKVLRMPPPKVLLMLKMGQIDAGFCCEQFPSMGVGAGFKELLSARSLWTDMQGSVLVVKDDLIKHHPEIVKKLVKVTEKATAYIHQHPNDAVKITTEALTVAGKQVLPLKISKTAGKLNITPQAVKRALFKQMVCTTDIDTNMVQQEINYLYKLGYIKKRFNAKEIVDLRFLK